MNDLISRQAAIDVLECQIKQCNKALSNFGISMIDEYAVKVERASLVAYEEQLKCLPSVQPEKQRGRTFREIVVEYPSYNTYPEYKGKPYFSIKYTENGQEFIGYGTYKPEVLSEYLKEYFMPSAQPETPCYLGSPCEYQNPDVVISQPERKQGKWIYGEHDVSMCDGYRCDKCGFFVPWDYQHKSIDFIDDYHICPNCGADMRGERNGRDS